MKINKYLVVLGSILIVIICGNANAITATPKNDSMFYYDIGGAEPISLPPSPITTTMTLSFKATFSGISCGEFDPMVALSNSMDALKDGLDDAVNQLESAATAAISALPGYLLQKANPGLYDLFQNGILRATQKFALSTKSCELMEAEMSRGIDPFEQWVSVSAGDDWKVAMGTAGVTDLNSVKEDIATNKGRNGVYWLGGARAGGVSQPPINVLRDVIRAGYNISTGRSVTQTSAIPITPTTTKFIKKWNRPSDAEDWVREVLGDIYVTTNKTGNKGAQPGRGIIPIIYDRKIDIKNDLVDMLTGVSAPTRVNLDKLSAPGVGVSLQLFNSIRDLNDDTERGIVVDALSTEIAEAQVIEEAILIRRLLYTGRKEGNISSVNIAQKNIDSAIIELNTEIDNLIFEKNIREMFVGSTAKLILKKVRASEQISRLIDPDRNWTKAEFAKGRVKP